MGYDDQMNLYAYVGNDPVNFYDDTGAIQRDARGRIIFKKTGKPGVVTHNGAPGKAFPVQPGYILADDGTKIRTYKNLSGDPRMDCDCHGYTFADGELWINNDQVRLLLRGDGYQRVNKPQVGDVAIYRDRSGGVHSAKIIIVNAKTGTIYVRGLGGLEVNTHPDSAHPGKYGAWPDKGASVEFWRKQKKEKEKNGLWTKVQNKGLAVDIYIFANVNRSHECLG